MPPPGQTSILKLRERERTFKSDKRHLCRDLFRRLGYRPFPSDDNIGEYLPFLHVREFGSWQKYNYDHWLLHWQGEDKREAMWTEVGAMMDGSKSLAGLEGGRVNGRFQRS